MTHSPAISVAMSVYNGADFLAEAIESILAQSFTDFELLILNDGSTDGSGAIIDDYAKRDARIRALHQPNQGLIGALNQLIDEARAPLIARMDSDDIALPERFARQIEFLNAHPDYGVIGTWTTDIDSKGNAFPLGGGDHPTSHAEFITFSEATSPLCHPSVMMRRDAVRAVGGYHRAFHHCEDYDLWLRLAHISKLCSLPERLLKYRHSDNQVSNRHVVTQQIGAAVAWYAARERSAGRADPTEKLASLPPVAQMDALFGHAGATDAIRARLVPRLIHSSIAMASEGFELMIEHIAAGGDRTGLSRTVLRLLRFGMPLRALRLAAALARH